MSSDDESVSVIEAPRPRVSLTAPRQPKKRKSLIVSWGARRQLLETIN